MTHALLELLGLAIPELEKVPHLLRRAELIDAAADICVQAHRLERAEKLREAANELRRAHDTQLSLEEIFSRPD